MIVKTDVRNKRKWVMTQNHTCQYSHLPILMFSQPLVRVRGKNRNRHPVVSIFFFFSLRLCIRTRHGNKVDLIFLNNIIDWKIIRTGAKGAQVTYGEISFISPTNVSLGKIRSWNCKYSTISWETSQEIYSCSLKLALFFSL